MSMLDHYFPSHGVPRRTGIVFKPMVLTAFALLITLTAPGCQIAHQRTDLDRQLLNQFPVDAHPSTAAVTWPARIATAQYGGSLDPAHTTDSPSVTSPLTLDTIHLGQFGGGPAYRRDVTPPRIATTLDHARRAGADLLLVYTLNSWHESTDPLGALNIFALGMLPTRVANAEVRVDWVLLETQQGGVLHRDALTDRAWQSANAWTDDVARRSAHRRAQKRAVAAMNQSVADELLAIAQRRGSPVRLSSSDRFGPGTVSDESGRRATAEIVPLGADFPTYATVDGGSPRDR